jgi:hypothetical protein
VANLHKFSKSTSISQRLLRGAVGEKTYDKLHPIGTALVKAETPLEPAPVVPMPDEEDIKRAKRRATAAQLQRSGRQSTILTDSDRLGP